MIIRAENISKTNGVKKILDHVSFTIEENDAIGVVGVNGIGKSTLLKIVNKKENYQGGSIIYRKDLRISYLPQIPDFDLTNNVIQEVKRLLMDSDVQEYMINSMLNKFGILDIHQPLKQLSGGQLKRLALAITLIKPTDLLILDEPTNHLDNKMIEFLEKYLIKANCAILMVTHDRYFLERVCHKIMEIDRTKIYEYQANFSLFLQQKQEREANDLARQEKRKQFLKKEIEWVRAGVQARSTKSKERLAKFEQLNAIEDIQVNKNVNLIENHTRLGKKTIELVNIAQSFDDKVLFQAFSYNFKRNDRIAIIGDNGIGKSTLLKIIAKEIIPTTGEVIYGETINPAFFKQGIEEMDEETRVIDYISSVSDNFNSNDGNLSAREMCERFLFESDQQYNLIKYLSGGEKRRLYLLKILMKKPNILLLDEPTNDLDIQTLAVFEDYLDDFNGIVIVVSHDRFFIDRICDTSFIIKDHQINVCNGAYSDNYDFINQETKEKKITNTYKPTRNSTSKDKKELANLEIKIKEYEEQIKQINKQLNEESDYKIISSLAQENNELSIKLEQLNEQYLIVLERIEG